MTIKKSLLAASFALAAAIALENASAQSAATNNAVVEKMIWIIFPEAWTNQVGADLYALLRPWTAQFPGSRTTVERMLGVTPLSPMSASTSHTENTTISPNRHELTGKSQLDLIHKLFALQDKGLASLGDQVTYQMTPGGAQVRAVQSGSYTGSTNKADWAVAYTLDAERTLTNRTTIRFAVVAAALDPNNKTDTETWFENFVGTDRDTRILGAIPPVPSQNDLKLGKTWPSIIIIYTVIPP